MEQRQSKTETTSVKGGSITRETLTGDLISVETQNGISEVSQETTKIVKDVTSKRHAALQRLANR